MASTGVNSTFRGLARYSGMKLNLICILLLLISANVASAQQPAQHLFIMSGQSNMARLDPDISFTPAVEAAFGKDSVIVVHSAVGGRPIRCWYKNWKPNKNEEVAGPNTEAKGDLYDSLMKKVKDTSEGKEISTVTFLWMQGERDAKESYGEVYKDSLEGLFEQLKQDLGRDDIDFVIGRLSDFQDEENYPQWDMVREAQVKVAESYPRTVLVNTDDLNDGLNAKGKEINNDLHYSVEGYKLFGDRLAQKSIALILDAATKPLPSNISELAPASEKLYDGSWESLQKMPVPKWFDDGKIGIFIHWGPYSAMGFRKGGRGYAEHVPKMIYRDPDYYFPIVRERWGGVPPEFGYKDIISDFKAENWDPDAWADLFSKVGAKYVVMTAEHHDGWANWDSDLTPWNAVDKGPKRDLVGDLGKALRKRGLKYAPSYHRERHQSFFAKKLYVVDAEPLPMIVEEIKRDPEAAFLYGPFGTSKEVVDEYVARWKEIQTKYKPDMLWMDDFPIYTRDGNQVRKGIAKPEIQYLDDQVRGMITDFMNDGAARGAEVYVNNKGGNRNWPDGVGCLEKDNLKLKTIGPKWQSCTTFGTSFGFLAGDKYKSVKGVIHEMVEVISRNGNFLINIGPKADGTLVPEQVERLKAMGEWLRINGDAIYGSRYWTTYQQESPKLAFTTNGKKLYAITMEEPTVPFTINATAGWKPEQVLSVRLLGSDAKIEWEMTEAGLQITPPKDLGPSQYAWSFEILTDAEQHHPNSLQIDASTALKGTKAVDLDGKTDRKKKQKNKSERR